MFEDLFERVDGYLKARVRGDKVRFCTLSYSITSYFSEPIFDVDIRPILI